MRDVNFNASQFSIEKEETEAVFSHPALLTKRDRRHKMTKCKANFCNLKKTRKRTEIRF